MHFQHVWIRSLFGWCSRRCGRLTGLGFDIFFDTFPSIVWVFGFESEHVVISFSAIADSKLWTLPIIALIFQTPRRLFSSLFKPWVFRRCGFQMHYLSEPLAIFSSNSDLIGEAWCPLFFHRCGYEKHYPSGQLVFFSSDKECAYGGMTCPLDIRRCRFRSASVPMF